MTLPRQAGRISDHSPLSSIETFIRDSAKASNYKRERPSAEGVSPRAPRLNVTFFLKTSVPDKDHISFDPLHTTFFACPLRRSNVCADAYLG
jgi:hypothetical protein